MECCQKLSHDHYLIFVAAKAALTEMVDNGPP